MGKNLPFVEGHGSNSTQIIVLKPGLPDVNVSSSPCTSPQSHIGMRQRYGKKLRSPFSLKDIKWKLKHAILDTKAERRRINVDGNRSLFHGYQGFKVLNSDSAKTPRV